MKKSCLVLLLLLFLVNVPLGKNLKINISAELVQLGQKVSIFDGDIIIPEGVEHDVFTGPFTIRTGAKSAGSGSYDFSVSVFGLAPDYHNSEYKFDLKPSEKMLIPSLLVKKGSVANYFITLLDDTSSAYEGGYSVKDTANWGTSETIHYQTHWVKGSLIDFTWNKEMGYLELLYNKYRKSYKLSEYNRINLYIHPEPTTEVYLDKNYNYSVQPKSLRIDLVQGHDIKALTPLPACELLMSRQWGYGPRWMVTGFANYYDDNMLALREFIARYDIDTAVKLLKNENGVRGDKESVFCGAFVFWLLQNESFPNFKKLYIQSTVLDFEQKFIDVYTYSLREALRRFLEHAVSYQPIRGELDYYASLFFERDDMRKAGKYYKELIKSGEGNRALNLKRLAACYFWTGEYNAADSLYDLMLELDDGLAETRFMKGEMALAKGGLQAARGFFEKSYDAGYSTAGTKLALLSLDEGDIESASELLDRLDKDARRLLDYSIEKGRLMIYRGGNADSLLNQAIGRAINSSNNIPHDPRVYVVMGKAYALLSNYEKAMYNFDTAYFLETNYYNLGAILLEMGKTEDLLGSRKKAKARYRQVIGSGGGDYQKSLAKKYIEMPFEWKK